MFPAPVAIPGGALLGPGLSVLADEVGLPGTGVVFGALHLMSGYVGRDCKNVHQRILGQRLQHIPSSTLRRTLLVVLLAGDPRRLPGT
ncbi:hypothetical protein GMA12_09650 [Kocuria sediminis]|uniref:Uncharacterized protein n=1 Tax=Kocuria sediminis TaxID=1038857 RepID=A0A6N8GMB7_9MICC|nr:hypothetical protein [Kocuria sediminis]MUN63400.1 hypothetical protein [Kocuria sediminis]